MLLLIEIQVLSSSFFFVTTYISVHIIIIYSFSSFSHQSLLMVSHWILRDSRSPLVPVPILCWLYLKLQLQLVSPSPSSSTDFFSSLARSRYLSFFSLSFSFTLWLAETAKTTIQQIFLFCWLLLGIVVWPRLGDPSVSQNPMGVCASHYPGQILGYLYTFFSRVKFKLLSRFSVDHLTHPIVSSLIIFLC